MRALRALHLVENEFEDQETFSTVLQGLGDKTTLTALTLFKNAFGDRQDFSTLCTETRNVLMANRCLKRLHVV
jgi:hypothetical protein